MLRSNILESLKNKLASINGLTLRVNPFIRPNTEKENYPVASIFFNQDLIENLPENSNREIESELMIDLQIIDKDFNRLNDTIEEVEKMIILDEPDELEIDTPFNYGGTEFIYNSEGEEIFYGGKMKISKKYRREYYHDVEEGETKVEV